MVKLKWVIDANILGNVCKKNVDNEVTFKFLTEVKDHFVLWNRHVLNEYNPMPGRKKIMCDETNKKFLHEWITEMVNKFGIPYEHKKLAELPECLSRQIGKKIPIDDCVYIQLALSNNDKLLIASETHFQNVKICIEGGKSKIRMFNESEALDFLSTF